MLLCNKVREFVNNRRAVKSRENVVTSKKGTTEQKRRRRRRKINAVLNTQKWRRGVHQ